MSDKPKNASKKGKKKAGKVIVPQQGATQSKKTVKKKFTSSKKQNAGKSPSLHIRDLKMADLYYFNLIEMSGLVII
jgi:hypothetical protein